MVNKSTVPVDAGDYVSMLIPGLLRSLTGLSRWTWAVEMLRHQWL
jgi:hypothetical protein